MARLVFTDPNLIARSPMEPATSASTALPNGPAPLNTGIYHLGSSHTGVINTLLGDGSVRGIAKTTDPLLMWQLTHVSDGSATSVP